MWSLNVNLHTPHPYMASPWAWIVLGRPTAFFYERHTDGHVGCHVAECSQAVVALGNPVIWWGGTLALAVLLYFWLLTRDWRAGAVLAGVCAGWLPWFLYQDRTIFEFYAVAFVPWVVLAVTYCLGLLLGPPGTAATRRRRGALLAGSYVFVAVMLFWFFYPVLDARVIPNSQWALRMWFPSWI
jgi:dolichyl-phosphate-mannose--protein O-mannosyl transferase